MPVGKLVWLAWDTVPLVQAKPSLPNSTRNGTY